jgi:hypothetical protein
MAGSFGVFRQYEKAALAGLAIMAMLAFFVLPPFLQMGAGSGGTDPMAVAWNGGGLRESGLQRAVIMRKVMNQFLVETMVASGQDPSRMRLADDERDVVDTILLAKEAEKNGVVVSNAAINQFLSEWTNDLVRPDQFEQIVARIGGRTGISQEDVFEALRTVLMARRMETLLIGGVGFEGAPPAWRWDYYRRLEQGATIEAIPVVVEQFADKLTEPSEATLRAFFEKYKDDLPVARSADPGFRQPHRIRYDYLVAKAGTFLDEEKQKVTDEQIKAFYEDRKEALFKAKPADEKAADAAEKDGDKKAEADEKKSDEAKDGDKKDGEKKEDDATKEAAPEFEPLEKVRDTIVDRLANEAVEKRVTGIFEAVKADVAKYAESFALWQVEGDGAGPAPVGPDVKKIAERQGLEGGTSDLVNANQAFAEGGIGGSFEFSISRDTGVRQQRWTEMMFGPGAQSLQAATSRDVDGTRYLSWKTEDQPEFTPSFQSARDDVVRAWRIVEARPLARKAAEEIAAAAKAGTTLEQVAATRGGLEVEKVGPFTWLTRGTAPFGSAPELSQPDGLAMPGEALMRAVFDLEPGQCSVAFNQPETVCYAVRVASFEPDEARLKELFLASTQDPRRLATVAEDDTRAVYDNWMKSIQERNGVAWKRDPRGPDLQ